MTQKNSCDIIAAKREDVPAIARLEEMCFLSPWSENAIAETMAREETIFLAAKKEGEVCGYIGSYYAFDEGYITNIAVSPDFRRRGIGEALITELIRRAREKELKFLTLEVRAGNSAAIALYEKMNFVRVGRRPGFYSNPREDAELMTYYI